MNCMGGVTYCRLLTGYTPLSQIESDGLEEADVEIIDNGTSTRPGSVAQRNHVTRATAQNGFASSSGGDEDNSVVFSLASGTITGDILMHAAVLNCMQQ